MRPTSVLLGAISLLASNAFALEQFPTWSTFSSVPPLRSSSPAPLPRRPQHRPQLQHLRQLRLVLDRQRRLVETAPERGRGNLLEGQRCVGQLFSRSDYTDTFLLVQPTRPGLLKRPSLSTLPFFRASNGLLPLPASTGLSITLLYVPIARVRHKEGAYSPSSPHREHESNLLSSCGLFPSSSLLRLLILTSRTLRVTLPATTTLPSLTTSLLVMDRPPGACFLDYFPPCRSILTLFNTPTAFQRSTLLYASPHGRRRG